MISFSNLQIPPPENWEDFEDLCRDLWAEIWCDPNTQKNGRRGQSQQGVDVFGRPQNSKELAGVQCKKMDIYGNKHLSEGEIRSEVDKAKSFKYHISSFILATTLKRDSKLQEIARLITEEHDQIGLFSVHIWSWDDIKTKLEEFPNLIKKHFPYIFYLPEMFEKTSIRADSHVYESGCQFGISSSGILDQEYQTEINYAKKLLDEYRAQEALDYLENLKKTKWHNFNSKAKFRILTNMGVAKAILGDESSGAKDLIEAYQYNAEDEKALCNMSLAYLNLGQMRESRNYANLALGKNPSSIRAYSYLIQTFPINEDLEKIIEQVPECHRNEPEIAYVFGTLALKRENLTESEKWLSLAVKNDSLDRPEFGTKLSSVMVRSVMSCEKIRYNAVLLAEDGKRKLNLAIQLIDKIWQRISKSSYVQLKTELMLNRCWANLVLGNIDTASENILTAIQLEPSNPRIHKCQAELEHNRGNNEKALAILSRIKDEPEMVDVLFIMSLLSAEQGNYSQAMNYIREFLEYEKPKELYLKAKRLQIQLFLQDKDFINATEVSDSLLKEDPSSIIDLSLSAMISRLTGDFEVAFEALDKAKGYINKDSTFDDHRFLADELYYNGRYDDAAEIYAKICHNIGITNFHKRYLYSLHHSGKKEKALEICRAIRNSFGILEYETMIEIEILAYIDALDELQTLCEDYLKQYPNESEIAVLLANSYSRCDKTGLLDGLLSQPIDTKELSIDKIGRLAELCYQRGQIRRGLEILYEARRSRYDDASSHRAYTIFLITHNKDGLEFLKYETISEDSAVCVRDKNGQEIWYTIENRKDSDLSKNEICIENPISKKLIGKRVGERINLSESPYSETIVEIVQIQSKFLYASRVSLDLLKRHFEYSPEFFSVDIGETKDATDGFNGLKPIYKILRQGKERSLEIEKQCKMGTRTVGAFAIRNLKDFISSFYYLTNNPELGIRCCHGTEEERKSAILLMKNKPKLIIDLVSLLTIHFIGAKDKIIDSFGKLGISRTTLNSIEHYLDRMKKLPPEGTLSFDLETNKIVMTDFKGFDFTSLIEYLEQLLEWISHNCEILPCKGAMDLKRDRRLEINKIIGEPFLDTLLIAKESDCLLFSDDLLLRSYAKKDFGIEGIWTQSALMYCIDDGILDNKTYNDFVIKLAQMGFHHTAINADILIQAVKQSQWSVTDQFKVVLKSACGNNVEIRSCSEILANFFYRLYDQDIMPMRREYLIIGTLEEAFKRKDKISLLSTILKAIEETNSLLQLHREDLKSVIKTWKQAHYLP